MKIEEAIKEIRKGNIVISCRGNKYKLVDNKICLLDCKTDVSYKFGFNFEEVNGEFKLYKGEPIIFNDALELLKNGEDVICEYGDDTRTYKSLECIKDGLIDDWGEPVCIGEIQEGIWYKKEG